jgi:hypothetical protein
MDRETKLNFVALVMVCKHGENASAVARTRMAEYAGDWEATRTWLEVADIADHLQARVVTPETVGRSREP